MATPMNHDPTPWRQVASGTIISINNEHVLGIAFVNPRGDASGIPLGKDRANASFIVRACNAHDALVAACKSVEDLLVRIDNGETTVRISNVNGQWRLILNSLKSALSKAGA